MGHEEHRADAPKTLAVGVLSVSSTRRRTSPPSRNRRRGSHARLPHRNERRPRRPRRIPTCTRPPGHVTGSGGSRRAWACRAARSWSCCCGGGGARNDGARRGRQFPPSPTRRRARLSSQGRMPPPDPRARPRQPGTSLAPSRRHYRRYGSLSLFRTLWINVDGDIDKCQRVVGGLPTLAAGG